MKKSDVNRIYKTDNHAIGGEELLHNLYSVKGI